MSLCLNGGEPSLGCIISSGTGFEMNCCILEEGSQKDKGSCFDFPLLMNDSLTDFCGYFC